MKALASTAVLLSVLVAQAAPGRADEVVPAARISDVATITEVMDSSDRMSGRITNHGNKRIDNVRLLVTYGWLWNDDRRTDDPSPGWTELHTLPIAIEAGQSVPFSITHERPWPIRNDGQLLTTVKVLGFTEWQFR